MEDRQKRSSVFFRMNKIGEGFEYEGYFIFYKGEEHFYPFPTNEGIIT